MKCFTKWLLNNNIHHRAKFSWWEAWGLARGVTLVWKVEGPSSRHLRRQGSRCRRRRERWAMGTRGHPYRLTVGSGAVVELYHYLWGRSKIWRAIASLENFFAPPLRSFQKSHLGRQNLLALPFQYIVTLANCNKTSIKKLSADSLARNKTWAVWWEAPLWWGAWGRGPLGPP